MSLQQKDVDIWGDKMDIQNIVTHEIGHAVGLSHSPNDPQSTMFPTSKTGETLRRTSRTR